MRIAWKTNINLHLNQSYINVWDRNHTPSRFRILTHPNSNSIPNDSDWDATIDINQKQFRFQLSLESESAPGLNHFPVGL